MIYFICHSLWGFNGISVGFKGPYHNIRMRLGKSSVVYDFYGYFCILATSHSARGRRDDFVATTFCPSQRRRRYVSNETLSGTSPRRLSGTSPRRH